ncbi:DNA damage-binding protein 1 [Tanacetum coccineum]
MFVRPVWRKKLNYCNTSNEVDVNLPTPMPKPQSPLQEPSQENPPTTHSNHDSLKSHSLPLGDSCDTNVGQALIPPQSANQTQLTQHSFPHLLINPHMDNKDARHVKTYEVSLKGKDFVKGPWSQNNLDNGDDLLIPVPLPFCGVLIIGEETIVYCSASAFKSIPIRPGRRLSTSAGTNVSRMSNAQPKRQLNLGKHTEEISQNKKGYIPRICPNSFVTVMKRCCDTNLKKLPEMDEVVAILEAIDTLKGGGMILSNQEQHGCFCFKQTRGT